MIDTKISALPEATLPLAGTEQLPVVQGGETRRVPASALGGGGGGLLACVVDQKASGTNGGASTTSYSTRTLNTVAFDPGGIVSLSSNTFTSTVDCGVTWSAPAYAIGSHKSRLVRVSDGAVIALGTTEYMINNQTVAAQTRSHGVARIEAGVAYRIEHRAGTVLSNLGFGVAASFGDSEIYTTLNFWS